MSTLGLLAVLLVLAYAAGFFVDRQDGRRFGLPSGSEFVLLGVVLGPELLGLINRATIGAFAPAAEVAMAWLLLEHGASYGWAAGRRVPARRILLGIGFGAFSFALVAGAVYLFLGAVGLGGAGRALLAAGVAAACAETARSTVKRVLERRQREGPRAEMVQQLAETDALVPLLLLPLVLAHGAGQAGTALALALSAPLATGLGLGLAAVLLLGRHFREQHALAVVLGVALLGIGLATRLELASLTVAFTAGLALQALGSEAPRVRAVLARSEGALTSPALLLAGACLELPEDPLLGGAVAVAIAARLTAKLLAGRLIGRGAPPGEGGTWLGLSLSSGGAVGVAVGLILALHAPRPVGQVALAAALGAALIGDLLGPLLLGRAPAGEARPLSEGAAR